MRIMLDTNVLISAGLFPNSKIDQLIEYIVARHKLVLSDLIINELLEVAAYKKFDKVQAVRMFLDRLSYTEFKTPPITVIDGLTIRDDADYPILFSAVKAGVDIFITGDKDFIESSVSVPKMMTMTQFRRAYMR